MMRYNIIRSAPEHGGVDAEALEVLRELMSDGISDGWVMGSVMDQ